ncbi:hypothetical protein MBLNU230_g3313t1 [Neophaeotheca triangularis]
MTTTANLTVPSLFSYKDHVVLVTGGATGLGEMAAQAFVQNGGKVIIASRKESELKKTSERLNKLGPGSCDYVVADLKDKAGCDDLVSKTKAKTDRLTVLINNSGASWGAPYEDFPESGFDKLFSLNVKSVFYTTVGLEGLLSKDATPDRPSSVLNVASMAGIQTTDVTASDDGGLSAPGSGTFSYGPSKAACIHLSRIQAAKLAPKNINVNAVCPGVFPSRMTAFGLREAGEHIASGQPTGRIGKPSDFAGLILFLTGTAGAHMVGGVFEIDGGATRTGFRGKPKPKESKM